MDSQEEHDATHGMKNLGIRSRFLAAISILVLLVVLAQAVVLAELVDSHMGEEVIGTAELDGFLRGLVWRSLAVGLFALLLGGVCAWWLSARGLAGIRRLSAGARRLADGDFGHRIALETGDELEDLGAVLNQIAGRLRSSIADLENSNESLNQLNEDLQHLDRIKGDLLANVSHELRTPLTAISGYVEALQEGLVGELDGPQKDSLRIVERNIRRLRGMIEQLLSYSRMESGSLKIELRPFDLEAIVRHAVEALTAIHGPELDLRCELPPDLPEVYGDAGRIAQVIDNLLTNAVKFSPKGSPVKLAVRDVSHGIEVAVTDRGTGIDSEVQEKVFDRFFQVDGSSRRRLGGMGLGLAIVREILELHHSEIRLDSRLGEGSTFRFVLPVAAERTGKIPIPGRLRIAVIDADAGFVQETAAHLTGHGFVVETAATAEQGFDMVVRVRPDAILLERLLPDSDGFDLLVRFAEEPRTRGVPVILATVRKEKALGLRLGAAGYLVKPVEPAAVEHAIREAVQARGSAVQRETTESPVMEDGSGESNLLRRDRCE